MGLPIFVDEVPEYETRGDNILLKWHGLELFVPIHVCIKSVGRCQAAIKEWEGRNADLIPIRVAK